VPGAGKKACPVALQGTGQKNPAISRHSRFWCFEEQIPFCKPLHHPSWRMGILGTRHSTPISTMDFGVMVPISGCRSRSQNVWILPEAGSPGTPCSAQCIFSEHTSTLARNLNVVTINVASHLTEFPATPLSVSVFQRNLLLLRLAPRNQPASTPSRVFRGKQTSNPHRHYLPFVSCTVPCSTDRHAAFHRQHPKTSPGAPLL
jgi:hypothetical protein